jgi:hypothetical protein
MDIGNKLKNKSGKQAKILISEMLYDLINDLDINVKIENGYSIGYPNQEKQLFMII